MLKLCLFLALIAIEIPLLRIVATRIGVGNVWVLVGVTAVVGISMGLRGLTFQDARGKKRAGAREIVLEPMGRVLCGILLFLPGFFTDALGAALLIPPVRLFVAALMVRSLGKKVAEGGRWRFGFHVRTDGRAAHGHSTVDGHGAAGPRVEDAATGESSSRPVDAPVRDARFVIGDAAEDAAETPQDDPGPA